MPFVSLLHLLLQLLLLLLYTILRNSSSAFIIASHTQVDKSRAIASPWHGAFSPVGYLFFIFILTINKFLFNFNFWSDEMFFTLFLVLIYCLLYFLGESSREVNGRDDGQWNYWEYWGTTQSSNASLSPRRGGPFSAHKSTSIAPPTLLWHYSWVLLGFIYVKYNYLLCCWCCVDYHGFLCIEFEFFVVVIFCSLCKSR